MTSSTEPNAETNATVSAELLAILVCPVDHAALRLVEDRLECTRCDRVYPIDDGIPNMLVDEGTERTPVLER